MGLSSNQIKKETLKELIWYISKNYNYQLFETKLWKLVFFCDTDYFEKYNEFLTRVPYIKNKRGPTPVFDIAQKAIKELVEGGYLTKTENGSYIALKDYQTKYISNHIIDAINTTCSKYYKLSVKEICTLAHRDPVYLATENYNQLLDFSFVAYRDDGSGDEDDDSEEISKDVVFSEKAKKALLKMAMA